MDCAQRMDNMILVNDRFLVIEFSVVDDNISDVKSNLFLLSLTCKSMLKKKIICDVFICSVIKTENHRYLRLKHGLWLPWVDVKARRKSDSKLSFLLSINSRITWEMMGSGEKCGNLPATYCILTTTANASVVQKTKLNF